MTAHSNSAKIAANFVRVHLGREAFAPLTGTDNRAWHAFVYLLELFGATGGDNALQALRSCYACTLRSHGEQLEIAELFRQTIPAILDWSDVARLWPKISPASTLIPHALYRAEHADGSRGELGFRER